MREQINLKDQERRDFWNLNINPITGFRPVQTNFDKPINIQHTAEYGSTSHYI